ncbi:MAG TPA: hypothetical protein VLL08_05975, partial [Kineosporiaceae bacterium]|nr:hypothetical protein [Kineosporiaceae bacterium]
MGRASVVGRASGVGRGSGWAERPSWAESRGGPMAWGSALVRRSNPKIASRAQFQAVSRNLF